VYTSLVTTFTALFACDFVLKSTVFSKFSFLLEVSKELPQRSTLKTFSLLSVFSLFVCHNINNNYGDGNDIPILPNVRVDKNSKTPAIKFLGIYLDPGLTFQFHLHSISSKISKALYVIKSVKKVLPQSALKTLYFSLIHCHFIYGINIWSASKQNLNSIFLKQKAALRTICEAKYNAQTEPLLKWNIATG
jgi:hypothetical protein